MRSWRIWMGRAPPIIASAAAESCPAVERQDPRELRRAEEVHLPFRWESSAGRFSEGWFPPWMGTFHACPPRNLAGPLMVLPCLALLLIFAYRPVTSSVLVHNAGVRNQGVGWSLMFMLSIPTSVNFGGWKTGAG